MTKQDTIIACRECDCLQREVTPPLNGAAMCVRCGAELYRNKPASLDHTLAFLGAAAIFFMIANSFPLLSLDTQGVTTSTTLFGTSHALYVGGDHALAVLVFINTILFPGVEIAAMIYLVGGLKTGRVPHSFAPIFRLVEAIKPWGMVSVFMLGTLVSLVKLQSIATLIPGLALYSLGAMILMLTASEASFEPRQLWSRAQGLQA